MRGKENAGEDAMKFLTAASWLHEGGSTSASHAHKRAFVPPCGERLRGLFEKRQVSFTGLKAGGSLCRKQWKRATWTKHVLWCSANNNARDNDAHDCLAAFALMNIASTIIACWLKGANCAIKLLLLFSLDYLANSRKRQFFVKPKEYSRHEITHIFLYH